MFYIFFTNQIAVPGEKIDMFINVIITKYCKSTFFCEQFIFAIFERKKNHQIAGKMFAYIDANI